MWRRALVGLTGALALGACVTVTSRERARIDALAATEVPQRRYCVELPTGDPNVEGASGQRAIIGGAFVDLPGVRGPDGVVHYPRMETLRRFYDLLVAFGLYTVEEDAGSVTSGGLIWRHYRQTPPGAAHLRDVPRHGQSSLGLLCYGKRRLVAIRSIGPVTRADPCTQRRTVRYAYVYEDLPAWADDPRFRAHFPDAITRGNAANLREDAFGLAGNWREWHVERVVLAPSYVPCR